MKQISSFIFAAILLVALNSCSSTFHSSTARTRNVIESPIKETSSIADLKVEETKVTGTSTGNNITDETAKNLAIYDALKKVNADVLVEPNYDIDRSGSSITVTVHGYPGFYKNFRRPTERDSLIMGWKIIVPPTPAVTTAETPVNTNTSVNITTSNVTLQQTGATYTARTPAQATMPAINTNNTAVNPNFINRAYAAITAGGPKAAAPVNYDVDAYKREKRKANNLLGWGITLLVTGVIIDGCSPLGQVENYNGNLYGYDSYTYDNTGMNIMLGVGSSMVVAGAVMLPFGTIHLRKARRIKNEALAQGLDFSVLPSLSPVSSHYGATFALKFKPLL